MIKSEKMNEMNKPALAVKDYIRMIPSFFTTTKEYTPRFLVPITRNSKSFKVLIKAPGPYQAMLIAHENFSKDGWEVDPCFEHYEEI